MYKYKKIISPVIMVITTICLIAITLCIIYFHIYNINFLKTVVRETDYIEKIENIIEKSFQEYMDKETAQQVLANDKVQTDIQKLINSIKTNSSENTLNEIRTEISDSVYTNALTKTPDEASSKEYATRISNIYVKNLLPVQEINLIAQLLSKCKNYVVGIFVIAVILLVLSIAYLSGAGKQKKWLFVATYITVIFCLVMAYVISHLSNIYYLNDTVTELLEKSIDVVTYDLCMASLVLVVIVIVLNYFEYFKSQKK